MSNASIRYGAIALAMLMSGPAMAHSTGWHAALHDAAGAQVGSIHAGEMPAGGVHLLIELTDMKPGVRAIHIHETGDCSAEGFVSAGAHMPAAAGAPEQASHASHQHDHGAHGGAAGDLPNLHVPETGMLTVEYFVPGLSPAMLSDENGASVIIHAGADDYSGVAERQGGAREVCGVFEPH